MDLGGTVEHEVAEILEEKVIYKEVQLADDLQKNKEQTPFEELRREQAEWLPVEDLKYHKELIFEKKVLYKVLFADDRT